MNGTKMDEWVMDELMNGGVYIKGSRKLQHFGGVQRVQRGRSCADTARAVRRVTDYRRLGAPKMANRRMSIILKMGKSRYPCYVIPLALLLLPSHATDVCNHADRD